jgi:lysine 2,3-aminomutase
MKMMNDSLEMSLVDESVDGWNDWRWQVANSLAGKEGLDRLREMGFSLSEDLETVDSRYPMLLTPYYLSLINKADPDDPIALQCLPSGGELKVDSFPCDPFSEHQRMPVDGLVHRFSDRVLFIATTKCAVNCRHCTRKNWITSSDKTGSSNMEDVLEYLGNDKNIREVIISGGDPLMLENEELEYILARITEIKHIRVLRLGTRVPVVLPMRVDDELCGILKKYRPLWINTQFNHPSEVTEQAVEACRCFTESGISVSNQSVLLRGVNDSEDVCSALFRTLQENMIRPYYMFLCDPVKGTAGFRVEAEIGRRIEESLRKKLGGLALPKFVADFPEEDGKVQMIRI